MCVQRQVTKLAAAKQVGRLTVARHTIAATIQIGDHTEVPGASKRISFG